MKSEIKERPILFSTPMVQAILEGRKTQTRRVVKFPIEYMANREGRTDLDAFARIDKHGNPFQYGNGDYPTLANFSTYGKVGDRLWVRESFGKWADEVVYKADNPKGWSFRPSIHMPKNLCRIFLEITNVRVERLHDITERDAIAEGIEIKSYFGTKENPASFKDYNKHSDGSGCPALYSFESLWKSINGEESWNSNPFVWVIEFKPSSSSSLPNSTT